MLEDELELLSEVLEELLELLSEVLEDELELDSEVLEDELELLSKELELELELESIEELELDSFNSWQLEITAKCMSSAIAVPLVTLQRPLTV